MNTKTADAIRQAMLAHCHCTRRQMDRYYDQFLAALRRESSSKLDEDSLDSRFNDFRQAARRVHGDRVAGY